MGPSTEAAFAFRPNFDDGEKKLLASDGLAVMDEQNAQRWDMDHLTRDRRRVGRRGTWDSIWR